MTSPIKVGFVGLSARGWAASGLAPSLVHSSLKDKFKLVAVSTTSEESAAASAAKHTGLTGNNIKAYHGPSAHIAADVDIDLVAVSVRAPLHKETILPVIEAGKNFFLEWPAGKNLAETREIAEAAQKHGVKSMIGLQGRNSQIVKKVKEIIASGAIGTVRSIITLGVLFRDTGGWSPVTAESHKFVLDETNGATPLSILIGHELDVFTQIFGEFATINATAGQVYPTTTIIDANKIPISEPIRVTIPDHYTIAGTLASGAVATIVWRLGYKNVPGRRQFLWEIDGEEGSIRLESDGLGLTTMNPTVYLNGQKVEVEGAETQGLGILVAAWEAYADGREEQYATIHDAVRNHERLSVISKSLKEGRTVAMNEVLLT